MVLMDYLRNTMAEEASLRDQMRSMLVAETLS